MARTCWIIRQYGEQILGVARAAKEKEEMRGEEEQQAKGETQPDLF
jgi:hypothetical protein